MHEYPITQQIIKIAENRARECNAAEVRKIVLVVGDYSGFIGDSIQMYFDVISQGTLCEGAEIEIKRVRPRLRCEKCGCLFEKKLFSFECPECGGAGEPTETGREFYIESIEIEV